MSVKYNTKQSAMAFVAGIERGQRIRLQRTMWHLCDENRTLGGKYWRTVLKQFGLAENQIWKKGQP